MPDTCRCTESYVYPSVTLRWDGAYPGAEQKSVTELRTKIEETNDLVAASFMLNIVMIVVVMINAFAGWRSQKPKPLVDSSRADAHY